MTNDQQQKIVQAVYHAITDGLLPELERVVREAVNDAAEEIKAEGFVLEDAKDIENTSVANDLQIWWDMRSEHMSDAVGDSGPERMTVEELVPRCCEVCNQTLRTLEERNEALDWGIAICDRCQDAEIENSCWCVYGGFLGGDPRQFQISSEEENTPQEIAAWRAECAAWEAGKREEMPEEEHGPWIEPGDARITLGARPSATAIGVCSARYVFGMGVLLCHNHAASADDWKSWPIDHRKAVAS